VEKTATNTDFFLLPKKLFRNTEYFSQEIPDHFLSVPFDLDLFPTVNTPTEPLMLLQMWD
jgi:hypothetical protein